MGFLNYLMIGFIWLVVFDKLLTLEGEENLTSFQSFITLAFWPVVLFFYILSYLYTFFNEID